MVKLTTALTLIIQFALLVRISVAVPIPAGEEKGGVGKCNGWPVEHDCGDPLSGAIRAQVQSYNVFGAQQKVDVDEHLRKPAGPPSDHSLLVTSQPKPEFGMMHPGGP
ncbi:hypothetical protein AX14_001365 [Amanita brunnescens Koide BX004]|nr:hypothetical protein AX14_001365 [Amanita brunnescens Koide BX004]